MDKKKWANVSPEHRAVVEKIAAKYVESINKANAEDNDKALAAMKQMGVEFLEFPKKDQETGKKLRAEVVKKLKGDLFSEEAYNKFTKEL